MLMMKNGTAGIRIRAARLKPGKRMTVAVLEDDYRKTNEQGFLEFSQTVETLRRAEALMDAALGDS